MNIFLVFACWMSFHPADTVRKPTLYDTLRTQLGIIDYADQRYRLQMDDTTKKYGMNSRPMRALFRKMAITDSINLIKVDSLISKYGWLSAEDVGSEGNTTIFAVIQHSDLKTQERYLPMMREAVATGKANPAHLALLEDRVALGEGRKQIYGSQLAYPGYAVYPVVNRDSVDALRAAVGLPSLAAYLKECCNVDSVRYAPALPPPMRK